METQEDPRGTWACSLNTVAFIYLKLLSINFSFNSLILNNNPYLNMYVKCLTSEL